MSKISKGLIYVNGHEKYSFSIESSIFKNDKDKKKKFINRIADLFHKSKIEFFVVTDYDDFMKVAYKFHSYSISYSVEEKNFSQMRIRFVTDYNKLKLMLDLFIDYDISAEVHCIDNTENDLSLALNDNDEYDVISLSKDSRDLINLINDILNTFFGGLG